MRSRVQGLRFRASVLNPKSFARSGFGLSLLARPVVLFLHSFCLRAISLLSVNRKTGTRRLEGFWEPSTTALSIEVLASLWKMGLSSGAFMTRFLWFFGRP